MPAEMLIRVRVRHAWLLVGVLVLHGWKVLPDTLALRLTNWLFDRLITVTTIKG